MMQKLYIMFLCFLLNMYDFDINDYIEEAKELENLFVEFVGLCNEVSVSSLRRNPAKLSMESVKHRRVKLSDSAKPIQRELLQRYEIWFAVTKLIVRQYSDRHDLFEAEYSKIKSYILIEVSASKKSFKNKFIGLFDVQVNILHTIIPIISLKETNLKKILTADFLNSELEQAEMLYKYDFDRASGAIAGVVLERYLKTLCDINSIDVGEKDTIDPLAMKLYGSDKVPDFDITLFKSIQHLASIRNKCTHSKEDVKRHEVRELLDKVKKITFLAF